MRDRIWKCADGRLIPISRMTDAHLRNAIAKVKRDHWRLEFLSRLELELTIRMLRDQAA